LGEQGAWRWEVVLGRGDGVGRYAAVKGSDLGYGEELARIIHESRVCGPERLTLG